MKKPAPILSVSFHHMFSFFAMKLVRIKGFKVSWKTRFHKVTFFSLIIQVQTNPQSSYSSCATFALLEQDVAFSWLAAQMNSQTSGSPK